MECRPVPVRSRAALALLAAVSGVASAAQASSPSAARSHAGEDGRGDDHGWVSLISDTAAPTWTAKFAGHPLETFRFEENMLRVVYDGVTPFGGSFGHIFHELPGDHCGDHDLGWTHEAALAGGPESSHRVFDLIREWTRAK